MDAVIFTGSVTRYTVLFVKFFIAVDVNVESWFLVLRLTNVSSDERKYKLLVVMEVGHTSAVRVLFAWQRMKTTVTAVRDIEQNSAIAV